MIYNGRKIRPSKRHKYGIADAVDRTYKDIVYGSAAEAECAQMFDLLVRGGVYVDVKRQVAFQLGDIRYVADFVVNGFDPQQVLRRWVVEVKGVETQRFRLVRRLWPKYGTMPMLIYKRKGKGWDVETIEGAQRPGGGDGD